MSNRLDVQETLVIRGHEMTVCDGGCEVFEVAGVSVTVG